MKVLLDFPEVAPGLDPVFLREALVATLYHIGKLSEQQACQMLGITRRQFEEMLPRFGFSVLVDSPANLDLELGACAPS
jgi:hypothetical protein